MGTVKYTGPVASFHCPTEATIRSLKVHFSPKQLGSGDPSPENVREIEGWDGVEVSQHGRNLYSKDNVIPHTADDKWNCIMGGVKQKIALNSWPRWTFIAPAIPNATYYWTVSCYDVGFLDKDKNVLTYKNGWSNTNIKAPADAVYVYHTWIKNKSMSQEQLDAAFETYDLYCDILPVVFEPQNSEKINYEFGVLGKNKVQFLKNSWTVNKATNGYSAWSNTWKIPNRNLTYTYSADIDNTNNSVPANVTVWFRNEEDSAYTDGTARIGTKIAAGESGKSIITIDVNALSNTYYLAFGVSTYIENSDNSCTFSNPMVELGSTATTYEPYNPNKTVYGGWVDLISGEVQETHGLKTFNGSEQQWVWTQSNNGIPYITIDSMKSGTWYSDPYTICDTAIKVNISSSGALQCLIGYNNKRIYFYNTTTVIPNISNLDDFTNWLSTNNITITYPLETPRTYYLAPSSMQTFLSTNNVWSNADYVEVEYDLHETQNILARKQFIIANQPHVVKPAAAPLQNFVTDMAAPVKSCKVYFSPVQDTSNGAPSPDNICPISGWTGVEAYRVGQRLTPEDDNVDPNANYNVTGNSTLIYDSNEGGITMQGTTGATYPQHWFRVIGEKAPSTTTSRLFTATSDITVTLSFDYKHYGLDTVGNTWPIRITGAQTTNIRADEAIPWTHFEKTYSLTKDQYISMLIYRGVYWRNLQVVTGTQSIPNATYTGTTLPITFPSEAGTIYGGYVDLVNGELIETYKKYNLGDLSAVTYGSASYDGNNGTNVMYYIINTGTGIGYQDGIEPIGDKIVCAGKNKSGYYIGTWSNPDDHIWEFCINSSNQLHVVFDNITVGITSDMSFAQRRAKITEWLQSNPITVVVPQQTPIIHPITSTQLKTLRGTNNIWSNANDNIELSYWKH